MSSDKHRSGEPKRTLGAALRPTGADVADLAGVSQSAVSRALRPGGSPRPKCAQRWRPLPTRLGIAPIILLAP